MAMPAPASSPQPYAPKRGNGCLWGCLIAVLLLSLPFILAGGYGAWFLWDGYNSLITGLSEQQEAQHWPTEAAILRNCYFGRADALFDLGEYDDAIQAYSAATNRYQHDPESLEAYVQIASCHRRMGRAS